MLISDDQSSSVILNRRLSRMIPGPPDEDVEAPVGVERLLDRGLSLLVVGHVAADPDRVAALLIARATWVARPSLRSTTPSRR